VTAVEFRGDLWHQKTRVSELSCCVLCVILRLAVLVELRLVSDTDTDGLTHAQHRAVKTILDFNEAIDGGVLRSQTIYPVLQTDNDAVTSSLNVYAPTLFLRPNPQCQSTFSQIYVSYIAT